MSLELLIFLVSLTILIKLGMIFFGSMTRAYRDEMADKPKREERLILDEDTDGELVEMFFEDEARQSADRP